MKVTLKGVVIESHGQKAILHSSSLPDAVSEFTFPGIDKYNIGDEVTITISL